MINRFQFCFNFAFEFNLRHYFSRMTLDGFGGNISHNPSTPTPAAAAAAAAVAAMAPSSPAHVQSSPPLSMSKQSGAAPRSPAHALSPPYTPLSKMLPTPGGVPGHYECRQTVTPPRAVGGGGSVGVSAGPSGASLEDATEEAFRRALQSAARVVDTGRGLHSSAFRLNVSTFCEIGSACRGCLGGGYGY